MQIFSNTHYDFIKWRWHAIILSALVILAGAVMVVQRGLPLGIDFSGGTIVVYHFDKPVTEDAIRTAIESDQLTTSLSCGRANFWLFWLAMPTRMRLADIVLARLVPTARQAALKSSYWDMSKADFVVWLRLPSYEL